MVGEAQAREKMTRIIDSLIDSFNISCDGCDALTLIDELWDLPGKKENKFWANSGLKIQFLAVLGNQVIVNVPDGNEGPCVLRIILTKCF